MTQMEKTSLSNATTINHQELTPAHERITAGGTYVFNCSVYKVFHFLSTFATFCIVTCMQRKKNEEYLFYCIDCLCKF